jgi:uncharacterized protein (DUF2062 family)
MEKIDSRGKEMRGRDRWIKWKRSLRLFYLRLLRLKAQPEEIAGGMAIGVFVGMTPTVPLHTVLAVSIAYLFNKSKLAAATGVWISNPLFLPLVYFLDYKVGRIIIGGKAASLAAADFSIRRLGELGWEISFPMFIGGLVTGLLLAIPSYFITRRIVILYRERRRKRLNQK